MLMIDTWDVAYLKAFCCPLDSKDASGHKVPSSVRKVKSRCNTHFKHVFNAVVFSNLKS